MEERKSRARQFNDTAERHEVETILSELPHDHLARRALRNGVNTLSLSGYVESPDISQRLRRAYLDGFARMLDRARKAEPDG